MNKDTWPLPRSLEGWSIFVALIILYGGIYYAVGFPLLWSAYYDMGKSVSLACNDGQTNQNILKGTIHYPRVVSDATKQFAFLTIVSQQARPLEDVTFWIASENGQNGSGGNNGNNDVIFLPHFVEGNVFQRTVSVQRLQPHERISFRLEILGVDKGGLQLRWRGRLQEKNTKGTSTLQGKCDATIEITSSVFPAIIMSLIQEILLPPWANSVIVVVALIGALLLENVWKRHRDDGLKKFCLLFEYGLALDVVLWGWVMSVTMMMVYWPVGKAQESEVCNWAKMLAGFSIAIVLIATLLWVWEGKRTKQIADLKRAKSKNWRWYCVGVVALTIVGIGLPVVLQEDILKGWPLLLIWMILMIWAVLVLRMWREERIPSTHTPSILRAKRVVSSLWYLDDVGGLTIFSLAEQEGLKSNTGLLLPPFFLLSERVRRYNERLGIPQVLLTENVYIAKTKKER